MEPDAVIEYAMLYGGPADGRVVMLGDYIPDTHRVPVPAPIQYSGSDGADASRTDGDLLVWAATYRVVLGAMGLPSRDDQGRVNYHFMGPA